MRKTKKTLASVAIVGMALSMLPAQVFAATTPTTSRLSGADRYQTAVQVAQQEYPNGATNAVLSAGANANLVDALTAAPLAAQLKAPILFTEGGQLTSATEQELKTLGVKNVYVTSGTGVITQNVINQLEADGMQVTDLGGADRYATAANIASKLTGVTKVVVTTGAENADALSVASIAAKDDMAILLSDGSNALPASEQTYLDGIKANVTDSYVLGGPTLVTPALESTLPGTATRIYGADRYATNLDVLKTFDVNYADVYVANGDNGHLVDALAASTLAAQTGSPIVLVNDNGLTADTASYLASQTGITNVTALGVVPDSVAASVGTTTPPTTGTGSNVTISNLAVKGQTVGTGTTNSPAVAPINTGITVNATIAGANTANSTVTYLVSNSTNITAKDANGNTLSADNLSTPIIVGNDKFNATYSVPADANGNVSITFTSTASSDQAYNVVVQAPFYNNGQPVRSDEVRAQWGVPGTLVLSPIYTSGSPDNLNFSSSSKLTNGLVPLVATYLPATGSSTTNSGQAVKFTMTAISNPNNDASAFFTDSTGSATVGQNSTVGHGGLSSATYNVTTDSNGQALVYINANQPSTNSVADLGAQMEVSVQAQLVNGGGSTNTGYYNWQSVAQASQIANLSPSQMLNPTGLSSSTDTVVATSAEKDTSGSQVTISGTVQDAAGNPVPNVTIALQDYDVTAQGAYSNNIQNDAYVQNGTTTLFSATNYPTVTTGSNGNFSFVVTANVPVTQSVYNSQTKYYIYYVPNTVSLANGSSLPSSGLTKLTFIGDSNKTNDFINLVWQQGQTVQAVGISSDPLQSQYSSLSAVPSSNQNFSDVIGSDQKVYVAGYNQNGQMVAPTSATDSGNQFAGYGTDFNITLPSGMTIEEFGNGSDNYVPNTTNLSTLGTYLANNTVTQAELQYYNGALYLVALNNTPLKDITAFGSNLQINDAAAYDGSGQLMFRPLGVGTTSTSGAINVTVSAYSGIATGATSLDTTTAQGAGSSSITGNFTSASEIDSLGVTSSVQQLVTYGPLKQTNAAPGNTATVSGTADDAFSANNNAAFVASAFNNYVAISPVPTQGLTYSLTASKSGKFRSIDGYVLQSAPQTASVNIQKNGLVSVNNTAIWSVPSGTTVVGYENVGGTLYTLAKTNTVNADGTYTYGLYNIDGSAVTGSSWKVNNATPAGYEGYLGFNIDSSGNLNVYDTTSSGSTVTAHQSANAQATAPRTSDGYIAPVQAITVGLSDKYAESPTVTVTNSVNSQTANVTTAFTSSTGGLSTGTVNESPSTINFVQGSSQSVTLTAVDQYGNALPNQTVYVQGADVSSTNNVNGLWITQVNGTAVQQTVNLAGSGSNTNSNFQTVNAPVPMFVYSSESNGNGGTLTAPAYSSVYVPGSVTAYNVSNGSTPYVALVTGNDGTVSFTVQNGNVQYWATGGTSAASNAVDPGNAVAGTLYFYAKASDVGNTSASIGSITVNVNQ